MPEGHLYHRYARRQQELVAAGPIEVTSPQGRFAAETTLITGRRLEAVTARGKNLFHHFEGDEGEPRIVHVHLGMQGLFLHGDGREDPKRQVRLRLAIPGRTNWDLIAPTVCALLTDAGHRTLVDLLGPDPLDPEADAARAVESLHRANTSIGAALLDQKILGGVGNVFRAEALLTEGIHPATCTEDLTVAQLRHLWQTLTVLMREAEQAGEIAPKRIYKQEHCARCGTETTTQQIGGRTAYTCMTCQPRQQAA